MVQFKTWQWIILATPIVAIAAFLLLAAGWQIYQWQINWIWAIIIVVFVGWRWLLVKWTKPVVQEVEVEGVTNDLVDNQVLTPPEGKSEAEEQETLQKAAAVLQQTIEASRNDPPIWEDWNIFWERCKNLAVAIAQIYHPQTKYPLLNIYVTQAYGLIRGTVDDLDRWMQQLTPVLNQVTVANAYRAYKTYRQLEPSARKALQVWNWAQWILNPAAAIANYASKPSNNRASQELLGNFNQILREAALRTLCQQAISLYGGQNVRNQVSFAPSSESKQLSYSSQDKTQTLQEIIEQAEPSEQIEQKPVSILLVGRTGAGKSSTINTLFQAEKAAVDVLPSTDQVQSYQWQAPTGETLTLWDTPGYEQAKREDLRQVTLECASQADVLLLVTPALDPALQMDVDFLQEVQGELENLPTIVIVTQVDRLRPLRQWQPPYNWENGDRPKEKSIREATAYRQEVLGDRAQAILPLVASDKNSERSAWNVDRLSTALMAAIDPAKQSRLARFLRDRRSRIEATAKVIDRYTFQMSTTQGLTTMLKSPILNFLSTVATGSPALARLLAAQIPVEQLPIAIGKLQMAYELFSLVGPEDTGPFDFDLLSLWPLLLENQQDPDRNAWAFGHAVVEYWVQGLTATQLQERFYGYLQSEEDR